MNVTPARRLAFEILRRVEDEGAYSSTLLAANHETLSAKDRALCHELVLGVLRNRLWLDRSIEHYGSRKPGKLDSPVAIALRLGLYQIRFLSRIPASAAVNESVNLVRAARLKSAATFVNAILRRATREANYDPAALVKDAHERLSIATSHPQWLIERWSSQFGFEQAAALASVNNQPAPLAFRFTAKARTHSPERIIEELIKLGAHLVESKITPGGWRLVAGKGGTGGSEPQAKIHALQSEGLVYFQDEASQLVAHLVGPTGNDRVLDVCAAPGSKSTLLAAIAPDALIVAGELHASRARTIQEFAAQQDAKHVTVLQHDATQPLTFPPRTFDRVLVDAPCSGTGTLRHNPEIRWRLAESDISTLAVKQRLILDHAAIVTRAGGRLLYSTCSVEIDENEAVIAGFLGDNRDFDRVTMGLHQTLMTKDGDARTWPPRDDVEGFFMATLQRNR